MAHELRITFKQGMGSPVSIQVPETDFSTSQALVRYTAGCLARGDTISVSDIHGARHNYPASTVLHTTVGSSSELSSESTTPRKPFMG